jgi:hypothetical protein|tara:strand:+ start:225 stop:773 length:549 start_codon:yes stop_codon:yes gene_type:complete
MALQKSKQLNPNLTGSFSLSGSFIGDSESIIFGGEVTASNAKVTGDLTVHDNILVGEYIKHKGDENTRIYFTDDRLRFQAGGIDFVGMHKKSSTPHLVTVNNGSNNIDFQVKDNSNNKLFRTDADEQYVEFPDALRISGSAASTGSFGHIITAGDINSSGRIFEQGSSVIDHATAMAIVFGG